MEFNNCLLILDRDGVINKKAPIEGDYILHPAQLILDSSVISLIVEVQSCNNRVVVATNQQCVGKKLLSIAQLEELHSLINKAIIDKGGQKIDFYVCTHLEAEGCVCRKPKPGLLAMAIQDNQVPLSKSIFIGDSRTDQIAAAKAFMPFILYSGDINKTKLLLTSVFNS